MEEHFSKDWEKDSSTCQKKMEASQAGDGTGGHMDSGRPLGTSVEGSEGRQGGGGGTGSALRAHEQKPKEGNRKAEMAEG